MKKPLFTIILLVLNCSVRAQLVQTMGWCIDSTQFSFSQQDSLHHIHNVPFVRYDLKIDTARTDSSNTALWQIGSSSKSFFMDSTPVRGLVTDTAVPYPINANAWFTIKGVNYDYYYGSADYTISFWHKYQTSAGHDGGLVEFSTDSGYSWTNIMKSSCTDTNNVNFYSLSDTLQNGEPAFSGASNSWIRSQVEIRYANPWVPLTTSCTSTNYWFRFRFVSDSIPDTSGGWMIKEITIIASTALEGINNLYKSHTLNIYPNPSADAIFNFPAMDKQEDYNIEIINALGSSIVKMPYSRVLNLSAYPAGLYFYRVTNGDVSYSGKLMRE